MKQVYDTIGVGYASARKADPRIEKFVWTALGSSRTVVNVGAGTGNYEPIDREVVAVEPSETMIAQRPISTVPVFAPSPKRYHFVTARSMPLWPPSRFTIGAIALLD